MGYVNKTTLEHSEDTVYELSTATCCHWSSSGSATIKYATLVCWFLFVCVYAIPACVHVCGSMSKCMERPQVDVGGLPQWLSTLCFETGSLIESRTRRLAWLASQWAPENPYIYLPSVGITGVFQHSSPHVWEASTLSTQSSSNLGWWLLWTKDTWGRESVDSSFLGILLMCSKIAFSERNSSVTNSSPKSFINKRRSVLLCTPHHRKLWQRFPEITSYVSMTSIILHNHSLPGSSLHWDRAFYFVVFGYGFTFSSCDTDAHLTLFLVLTCLLLAYFIGTVIAF